MLADTHPAARRKWIEAFQSRTPGDRLRMALRMSDEVRQLSEVGATLRNGVAGARTEDAARAVLGGELAEQVLGARAKLQG